MKKLLQWLSDIFFTDPEKDPDPATSFIKKSDPPDTNPPGKRDIRLPFETRYSQEQMDRIESKLDRLLEENEVFKELGWRN